MNTIKEVLDNLKEHERQQLMYGFEHEFAQYVCLDDNQFIGVNVEKIKHLEIKQQVGVWSTGIVKGENKCNM
jgi:non-homologous end joining protein Ku